MNWKKQNIGNEKSLRNDATDIFRVLEKAELDSIKLNIDLVHDDRRTQLGKPYLTVLLDCYSEMMMGFQISFEPPSSTAANMACLNAFVKKDKWLKALEIKSHWPAHGLPKTLLVDQGSNLRSRKFENVLDVLGVSIEYSSVRNPSYRSRTERLFRLMNKHFGDS